MSERAIDQISTTTSQLKNQQIQAQKNADTLDAAQDNSQAEFSESCDMNLFNPLAIARRFDTIERRMSTRPGKENAKEAEEPELAVIESVEEILEDFTNRNPELTSNTLMLLRSRLKDSDTMEDIIKKLQELYPDHYLADEALDFLIKTTDPNSALFKNLLLAKDRFNVIFKREITAGKNMTPEAKAFADQGVGTPTQLRDLYKQVTGQPKEPAELFEELSEKYDFEKLTTVIKFLMQSLGADMKSKGPSIARPELQTLFNETRNMQSILGVYRFFQSRMSLISKEFERNDLTVPARMNFEVLSKQFVKLISERYPSIDKVLKLGVLLGIGDDLLAQIIVYTQFRDGIRQVSPKLFKGEKHKQDLLLTLLDALSDLEDELDEDEEEED
jgi:type III secretion protein W